MLIDAFLGFNEIELAKFRIGYLSKVVDKTIILESSLTHSGKAKNLYFSEYFEKNPNPQSHIEVIEVDLRPFLGDPWKCERFSRNFLVNYLFRFYPNSEFILSDLDEIPSVEGLKDELLNLQHPIHLRTPTSYRWANFTSIAKSDANWHRVVLSSTRFEKIESGGRFAGLPISKSLNLGLHCTYLSYHTNSMREKLESFAHQELPREIISDPKVLTYCDKWMINHLGRFESRGSGLLKVQSHSEFSKIVSELYDFNSNWFLFPAPRNKVKRLFASFVISETLKNEIRFKPFFSIFVLNDRKKRSGLRLNSISLLFILVSGATRSLVRKVSILLRREFRIASKIIQNR